jgi:hypothetical protein
MSGSGMVLPPPDLPFPVTERYRVVPDMHRLGGELFGRVERGHFQIDDALEHYLERKLAQLEGHAAHCRRLHAGCDEAGLSEALRQVFALLAEEHPELVEIEQEKVALKASGLELDPAGNVRTDPDAPLAALGERAARWLSAQRGVLRLADALALTVQEDFVIMRGEAQTHGAELLHVCFPSHWHPAENAGLGYAQIHAPVAHNAPLLASARRVMKALFSKGPFVRYTWGLVTDPRLDHNPALPDYPENTLPEEVLKDPARFGSRVFLRVERQTTCALPALQRCLFTIRVSVRPLAEVLSTDERKRRLAAALRSMDDDLLRYKGLTRLRAPLLAWLEA